MNDTRFLKIQKGYHDAGGLVTAYAIQTKQPMRNAINELRDAGMVYDFDNVLNEGLAFSKVMTGRDGTLVGIPSDIATRGGTEHVMSQPNEVRKVLADRVIAQQRIDQSPAAKRIFEQAADRVDRNGKPLPMGLLGPVYERAARVLENEWEASGRHDKAAFRSAKVLMTLAVTHAASYTQVESYHAAKQMMPMALLKNAARKLTGRADPEQERQILDLSIWSEPDDPFKPVTLAPKSPEQSLGEPV
ncbi:hypothetical protein LCGC14_0044270 [marine sediment metagenome]|mgnify:CR=1 FL=1|uniref:Uncharacterized protein n=2 Tax=root TaxID=1 RepID=A0A7V1FPJ9_9RHOB|nr:hypothetical protein [Sulfitobacter litoralis]HDZ53479.1 hypothetical protein [Sulfitobacter litoralis]